MSDDLRLNLGALRSTMQLTLHTHHASRIWHGRAPSEHHPGIIGLSGFLAIMNKIKRSAEQDDPYADAWMLRIEDKLNSTKATLQALRGQIDQVLAEVPATLSLGENLNLQPIHLPLFVNAQLGFVAIYLLADYDDLARRVILAHHTALIDRETHDRWLDEGAHALRSLFRQVQPYRGSGAQRNDFAADNALARMARARFGELPKDVLDGSRRSRFAPPMIRRAPLGGRRVRSGDPSEREDADADNSSTLDEAAPVEEDK
ncbi:PFL_4669 family integrating conjugative element protein [Pseudomonas fluorescens]|uniref:PFL_4669 family integrating conjugative element protein n=1 Tax=Pseudomonas fluorescens TaxID=294 RepID=UPI001BE961ED|nr:TIGR03761 family integrating conjugative element protein [Pseudomonas fluorescens]MBT2375405.1 TIGR03761 family integrating conjugative element protein [Pseudomonas fluorescens]